MDKFSQVIEEKVVPKVSKITNHTYFQALRNGFFAIMPLTIIGSIFMLITDFPVPGYAEFMTKLFGENWASYISPAYRATFNMMGFMFVGTMAYKLAEQYKLDKLSSMVLTLVAYVVVMPKSVVTESGEVVERVLSFTWLGTQGVITAIFVAIISVELIRFCVEKNLTIKMPESVPEMVSKSFSALIPGVVVVTVMLIINGLSSHFSGSLPELMYSVIQIPLQGLTGSVWAIVIVSGLNGLFWWFGIHPTVINSIVNPLLYANAAYNQELFDAGKLSMETGKIGTIQMIDQFATIGGAGCTIGLVISMLLVAKSSRMKTMSKLVTVPALFNINEPLVFGLPIIFNPMMLIPVTLAPLVSTTISYLSMKIGFMDLFTNIQAPWATPFVFSGFLVAGWQGVATQLVAAAASTLVYYPFVKALEKQYMAEEIIE
ncbi:PTS sugar transporter subunit IIC [Vagococcus humatus]|uniref:Permease IIC component n=1 Tax=Vagococcus humatus TaxID=1889241 RepID=A0A3S0GCT5_9ENTE|nr:PTS sugar transporter subunit IIC [Vagococcus humatus]RST88881.1 PTS cellbiose transporter subunit IIC [Vagococcus humatus]